MTAEARLIDTNILVHAYTVSDTGKHATALSIIEKVWQGESAATTLQNLCEMFSVITRKVARPVSASSATAIVEGILTARMSAMGELNFGIGERRRGGKEFIGGK